MKCVHCGKSPHQHGITLLRQNPKGEMGVWACEACNCKPLDEKLSSVIAEIQGTQKPSNKFRMH